MSVVTKSALISLLRERGLVREVWHDPDVLIRIEGEEHHLESPEATQHLDSVLRSLNGTPADDLEEVHQILAMLREA